jgi:hypothetical protein
MIAEISLAIGAIKAANEAIGAIREGISNVQSIGQLGGHLTKLTDASDELEKKAKDGDMEAFFALESIRQERENIKRILIYEGRAGIYDDWLKFEHNRRQMKENEKKRIEAKRLAKKKAIKNALTYGAVGLFTLGIVGGAVALLLFIISHRGR